MAARYPEDATHDTDCEKCQLDETELLLDDGPRLERDLAKFRVWNKDMLKFEDCPKNGKHENFISPDKFCLNDLPEPFRDQEFLDTIMSFEKLTVKIKVKSLSDQRSDDDDTNMRKTQLGVKYGGHIGSGWISSCYEFHKSDCNCCSSCFDALTPPVGVKNCPCLKCINSQTPKQEWGILEVQTAKHVVFDSTEAFGAELTMFYNSYQTLDQVKTLSGFRVKDSRGGDDDSCRILVITHDEHLHEELSDIFKLAGINRRRAVSRFSNIKSNVTIIISHPHGFYKQITVGKHLDKTFLTRIYVYTTPTCPGSSGAPCYVFGRPNDVFGNFDLSPKLCFPNSDLYRPPPHRKSHSCQDRTNSSGFKWYMCSMTHNNGGPDIMIMNIILFLFIYIILFLFTEIIKQFISYII